MKKETIFIKALIVMTALFFLLLCEVSCHSVSAEDMVESALQAYKEQQLDHTNKSFQLYKQTLQLALNNKWQVYSSRDLQKAINKSKKLQKQKWNGTQQQKIKGLLKVYSSVKKHFAGFEMVPELNWDHLVIDHLGETIESESMEDYYKILLKLVACLKDHHTYVVLPKDILNKKDKPPLSIEYIEDKFIITDLKETEEFEKQNIYPGLEIIKVEGIPAKEYFTREKLPYLCLSKVQRENFYLVNALLQGNADSKVHITVSDISGQGWDAVLSRNSKEFKQKEPPKLDINEIEPGILYFKITAFWPYKELKQKLEKEFDRLDFTQTRGLILDVRENAGGNSKAGDFIISYLIDKPFRARLFKARKKGFLKVLPNIFAKAGVSISSLGKKWFTKKIKIKPYSKKHFSGPVTVLINRHTASAAEDFAAAFKENKRALLVGETTSGGTGNGIWSVLPGYGRLRVTVNLGAYVNGDLWHSVGIKPDVKVQKQRRDITHHRDPVIEKSIEIIKYLQETEHLDFNSPEFTDVMSELLTHDMSLETKLEIS